MLQTTRQKKYRFSVVVEELRATDNTAYQTMLLELVNCLLIYSSTPHHRVSVRNEFFGRSWMTMVVAVAVAVVVVVVRFVCLLVGYLTSQQHARVSQGRICTDNFTCCHTETEVADQTFYLTTTPGRPVPALTL